MASVGDKVRVLPNKAGQPAREGVVTGQTGSLLHVRWTTGEESSFIPGPGAVTVIGRSRARTGTPASKATSGTVRPLKRPTASKAASAKAEVTKKPATKKPAKPGKKAADKKAESKKPAKPKSPKGRSKH